MRKPIIAVLTALAVLLGMTFAAGPPAAAKKPPPGRA